MPPGLEKLVPAAVESVEAIDGCYAPFAKMALPNDDRTRVAAALIYASLEQARSAAYLVANDAERSLFAAMILFRSQIDQLMRASFFAGPASASELAHFLENDTLPPRNGQKLGPISLAKINSDFFKWKPEELLPGMIAGAWRSLCGMTHGGHALIGYYVHQDGIGPTAPTDECVEILSNAVAMAHLGMTVAVWMATNIDSPDLQAELQVWEKTSRRYFGRWGPEALNPASGYAAPSAINTASSAGQH